MVTISRTPLDHTPKPSSRSNNVELGPPLWIETTSGFPDGSLGDRADLGVVVSTDEGDFTGSQAADLAAFTDFLVGAASDDDEREWLIDAVGREFVRGPAAALEELERVSAAVQTIAALDPVERANSRYTTLTTMYQSEPAREEAGIPESPMMTMLKAHNPALMIDESGIVIATDCIDYRRQLNQLILSLAGRDLDELAGVRADLTTQYQAAPVTMKAELAGSQVRLVLLRSWLAALSQADVDQLRDRLGTVIDTTTDLDLVALQLSFRSMIEAAEVEDLN